MLKSFAIKGGCTVCRYRDFNLIVNSFQRPINHCKSIVIRESAKTQQPNGYTNDANNNANNANININNNNNSNNNKFESYLLAFWPDSSTNSRNSLTPAFLYVNQRSANWTNSATKRFRKGRKMWDSWKSLGWLPLNRVANKDVRVCMEQLH